MNLWKKIAHLGVSDNMPVYKQKSTIFFNIVMRITAIAMVVLSMFLFFGKNLIYTPLGFILAIPVVGLSLFLNYKGKVNISVFIILIFFPFYCVAVSIFAKTMGEGLNLVLAVMPRFGIIIFSIIGFAVLGFDDIKKAFLGVSSGLIAFLFFNKIHYLFGIDIDKLEVVKEDFDIIISATGGIFIFFINIIFYLQKINAEYEKIVTKQRDGLSARNTEIILQKEEIETQRDEIEAQRDNVIKQRDKIQFQAKHITDSIRYASRIQAAVLPPEADILNNNMFVLFKPRDIVSGDFYMTKRVQTISGEVQIIVAGDCTGHGVPGAFVSMLGISFLNDIISNYNNLSPDLVLNELRNRIKTSLHQDGKFSEQKDGMDIAICVVDYKKMTLNFAGANNPLYLIVNDEMLKNRMPEFVKNPKIKILSLLQIKNSNLVEIKGDRMPVGVHIKERKFTKHKIQIQKNDMFYIFSDGFSDQFGGEKGYKFKTKNFKNILLSINKKNLPEQKLILNNSFEKWKKNYKQIDDVLVIGFKI